MPLGTSGNMFVAILFLSLSGVLGQNGFSVTHSPERICGLQGSSVVLPCTYTYPRYPSGQSIQTKQWYNKQDPDGGPEDLSKDLAYTGRVTSADRYTDCSLTIIDLRKSDSGKYHFRFKAWERYRYTWISVSSGVSLSVTDLQVKVDPATVKQRMVTVTCNTTCTVGSNLYYNWYKNGEYHPSTGTASLSLESTRSNYDGSYSCAVRGVRSPAVCVLGCWGVTYTHGRICALKGSSVDMPCTYTYPRNCKVTKTLWYNKWEPGKQEPDDLILDREYQGRVEYRGNKENDCTLRITDLRESDSGEYHFRITTDQKGGKYSGKPVPLSVTDLQVKVTPDTPTEGQGVTLTCNTTCTLSNSPTYIWYKNVQPVTNRHTNYNNLFLNPVSSKDTGSYSCAVRGHEDLISPAVSLNVRYPPKNTSVSVSSSAEIVEGSSVTLTCSSDANPPVLTYAWYKNNGNETSLVGSGHNYIITNISSEHSGQYYCKAVNVIGEGSSTEIHLNVTYPPKKLKVSVSPSGEIVEGISVTLTCSSDANPPVLTYTWYKNNVTSSIETGQDYIITNISSEHSGQYYCEAEHHLGAKQSTLIPVDVLYSPKNTSVSVSPNGNSVTLTCSSDANPPVLTYTWYKKDGNETSLKSTGKNKTLTLVSGDSGLYYCEAKNTIGGQNCTEWHSIIIPGEERTAMYAGVGITVVVALILVPGILWMRKRKTNSNKDARSTEDNSQIDSSPVYDNVSAMAMTPDPAQRADTDDQDDVHYASVHFNPSNRQEVPLYSTAQPPQTNTQEEDVQYAIVKFSRPSAATRLLVAEAADDPSLIYSQIN